MSAESYEEHDMFDCDCHSCERKLMLHYMSLQHQEEENEEYYRCDGFDKSGKMIWTKVDI